jgi:hypothetical protein
MGVRVLFENSTVCQFVRVCELVPWAFWFVVFAGIFSDKTLLESLILAQDERWRRALHMQVER